MGAKKEGATSTPKSLPGEQETDGTPSTPPQTDQPSGSESESFSTVNRDGLSPELQAMYDNMQRAFTQKTQEIANERSQISALRNEAQVGRLVMQNPELRTVVRKVADGYSVTDAIPQGSGAPQPQPQPEIDPETDPLGYIDQRIETKMRSVLGEFMPKITDGLSQVRGFVAQSQANTEFEQLCAKYPLARDIGSDSINYVRSQYQTAGGAPIGMEDAYILLAKENPAILGSGTPQGLVKTPPKAPANPPVESGSGGGGGSGRELPEAPSGVRAIQQRVRKILENGEMSEEGFTRRLARRAAEELSD